MFVRVMLCSDLSVQVFDHCMKKPKDQALELVEKLGIKLTHEDKELHEKQLLKACLDSSIPIKKYWRLVSPVILNQ